MARFVLSQILRTGGHFPWATLAVNVVGSLAFGIPAGWSAKAGSGEWEVGSDAATRNMGIEGQPIDKVALI